MHACICVCMYVCMYTCMYVYACICVCMHVSQHLYVICAFSLALFSFSVCFALSLFLFDFSLLFFKMSIGILMRERKKLSVDLGG